MTATALQPVVAAAALSVALASSIMNLMSPTRMTEQPAPAANQLTEQEKRAGWSLLFDGKSLNGWRGYKKPDAASARWRVEDGWLTVGQNDGKDTRGALDLISVEHFDRFELRFEWRVAEAATVASKLRPEDMDAAIGHDTKSSTTSGTPTPRSAWHGRPPHSTTSTSRRTGSCGLRVS
jgi:hypothetical protein